MYFEGLNSDFCDFIEDKIRYIYHVKVADVIYNGLFQFIEHENFFELKPLFNYDSCTSNNPKDHTEGNTLILEKDYATLLSFESREELMEFSETSTVQIIEDIRYTLYYTFNPLTGEPVPFKMTSSGNVTDEYGYFLDSEVIV